MHYLLHKYINGNTSVSIFSDGSKIREYEGEPKPVHPESCDVKITDFCDGACSWCHEKSTTNGKHANLDDLLGVVSCLPAGVELAIGGGNPLTHPDLLPFLKTLRERGIVSNMTINQKHLNSYYDQIKYLIENKLINGVGISYSNEKYIDDIVKIINITDNVVFHLIMGINNVSDIDKLNEVCINNNKKCKILVLGYKNYGFGLNFYLKNKNIEDNKNNWYMKLASKFYNDNITLSFDNLAIEQMKLRRFFTDKAWKTFYMGEEGKFTCFIDAVKQQFAISSTANNRISFNNSNLLDFFAGIL